MSLGEQEGRRGKGGGLRKGEGRRECVKVVGEGLGKMLGVARLVRMRALSVPRNATGWMGAMGVRRALCAPAPARSPGVLAGMERPPDIEEMVAPKPILIQIPEGFKPPAGYEKLPLMIHQNEFFDGMDPLHIANPTVEQLQQQVVKYWEARPQLKEVMNNADDGEDNGQQEIDWSQFDPAAARGLKEGKKRLEEVQARFNQMKADNGGTIDMRPVNEKDNALVKQMAADYEKKYGEKLMVPVQKRKKGVVDREKVLRGFDLRIDLLTGSYPVSAVLSQMQAMGLSEKFVASMKERLEVLAKPNPNLAEDVKSARELYVRTKINGESREEITKIDWSSFEKDIGKGQVAFFKKAWAEAMETWQKPKQEDLQKKLVHKLTSVIKPAKAEMRRLYEECLEIEDRMRKVQEELGWLVSNYEVMTIDMYLERYPEFAKQLEEDYKNDKWDAEDDTTSQLKA
ncbi:hypothetical protein FVE85_5281 [Porphyridium purpureum]|uniref:Uncharacterized protein n=1 Tax=Porphyridium purpureum TaxID=35688 RepID=A0A5J4Z233_PORPP|nr:hypothetical protein FVE85_5281 [Porphyridium purpureum]|eukprot:POR5816..scf295_1